MSNDIKILDNFLDEHSFNTIKDLLMGTNFVFPWYYMDSVVISSPEEKSDPDTYQFSHMFFDISQGGVSSPFFNTLQPLLDKLEVKTILRVKSNLLTKNENPKYFKYHVDVTYPTTKTAIYYINTNNGSTIFETGLEVQSIANRAVIFDSNIMHTGKCCSDESVRVLINFNYFDY